MTNHTKERIAQTAFKYFLENGYIKTTLRKIAETCNITHANVLYHYKNKYDLGLLFQHTYFTTIDKYVSILANEKSITPSIEYYSLYWIMHYLFILEYPNFAKFYEEFVNTNRQEIASDKLNPQGYLYMTQSYTNMDIAYTEPELSLNMHLLIEADAQIIKALSLGEINIHDALAYYLKNSLRLLVNYDIKQDELLNMVHSSLLLENTMKLLLKQIEEELFVEIAE